MDTAKPVAATSDAVNDTGNHPVSKTVKMYTTTWCGDCRVTKSFLEKFDIPFEEINIEHDPEAADYVMRVNGGRRSVPTLVYNGDATSLSRFSRSKLDAFLLKHNLQVR